MSIQKLYMNREKEAFIQRYAIVYWHLYGWNEGNVLGAST